MPFNVLLLPLLGGYIFINKWNRTRFRTKRDTGERLLFHSGFAGVVLLVIAFIIVHIFTAIAPRVHDAWLREVPFPYAGTSLLALILGSAGWWPANLLFPNDHEARRVLREWGDHLEILFDRALTENRQVSLTLKGGKVYIGFILENFDPSYDRKYVSILPIASGYRDSADQSMVLTVPYGAVYVRLRSQRPDLVPRDFQVVIPVAEVQSANLFDWDAFDEFQALETEEREPQAAQGAELPSRATAAPTRRPIEKGSATPTGGAGPGHSPPSTRS